MEKPKCPYCGSEMKYDFNDDLETHWLYCPKCGARSSVVSYDDNPYAAAMKRNDNLDQLYERLRVRHGQGGK